MKEFKRGEKVICNMTLWQGKIGRVIEDKGDLVFCAFGEFELDIEKKYLESFNSEFIKK